MKYTGTRYYDWERSGKAVYEAMFSGTVAEIERIIEPSYANAIKGYSRRKRLVGPVRDGRFVPMFTQAYYNIA